MSALGVSILCDYPLLRFAIRGLVGQSGDHVVHEDRANLVAIPRLEGTRCDLLLLEVGLTPPSTSVAICSGVRQSDAPFALMGIECLGRPVPALPRLVEAGMTDFISIGRQPDALAVALGCIKRGESVMRIAERGDSESGIGCVLENARAAAIDEQDAEILYWLDQGLAEDEVAKKVHLSRSTVRHRVMAIEQRAHLTSRYQLGRWAAVQGYIGPNVEEPTAKGSE